MTRNFTRSEFACRCGCGADEIRPELVARLQQLRDRLGLPITVNCGVRCAAHNRSVGGVRNSRHLTGEAADIAVPGVAPEPLAAAAKDFFTGIGVYRTFVHVDIRAGRRASWKG